jgi:hypothetical protein
LPLYSFFQTLSFDSLLFCSFVLFLSPSPTFSFLQCLFHFRLFLIFPLLCVVFTLQSGMRIYETESDDV